MKRSLFAAAALLLAVTGAQADKLTTLSRSGAWETYITTSDKGNPLCGMQVFGNKSAMIIKYFVGSEMLIHIYKIGWRIPDGTKIPGYIRFDNGGPVEVSGFGGKSTGQSGISFVEFRIKCRRRKRIPQRSSARPARWSSASTRARNCRSTSICPAAGPPLARSANASPTSTARRQTLRNRLPSSPRRNRSGGAWHRGRSSSRYEQQATTAASDKSSSDHRHAVQRGNLRCPKEPELAPGPHSFWTGLRGAPTRSHRSSSGCTHLYGVISRCSVNLIMRTGGL